MLTGVNGNALRPPDRSPAEGPPEAGVADPAGCPVGDPVVDPADIAPLLSQMRLMRRLLVLYQCAIREVRTKLEILDDEFRVKQDRSPIDSISSRVKQPESIARKLTEQGFEISWESAANNLDDVAGIRVVCPFIQDIYSVADTLLAQDDLTLVNCRDYIKQPKPSGYRSLHLVVEIPVYFSDRKQPMRVEIQIRTIGMNFWASLEHEIRYKQDLENPEAIAEELKECAETIWRTDRRMQEIHQLLHGDERGAEA